MDPHTIDCLITARVSDLRAAARAARAARARRRPAAERLGWLLVHTGLRLAVGQGAGTERDRLDSVVAASLTPSLR